MGVNPVRSATFPMKIHRCLLTVLCWSVLVVSAPAAEEVAAVIARARSFLGTEEAISRLQSVHYIGVMELVDAGAAKEAKPVRSGLEVIFQKPYRQLMVITSDTIIETTGLDDFDAWVRQQQKNDPTRWRMRILAADDIRRLRAVTWENLAFFQGIEAIGGKVVDRGDTVVDGKACRKLTFTHEDGSFFDRYFDNHTGQLLLTESENGTVIREEGEVLSNGLKFPRRIVTINKEKGKVVSTMTIDFDKVATNETFDARMFAVPAAH